MKLNKTHGDNFFRKHQAALCYIGLVLVLGLFYIILFAQKGFMLFGDFSPTITPQVGSVWSGSNLGYDASSYLTNLPFNLFTGTLIKFFGLNIGTQLAFFLPLLYFISVIYWLSNFGLKNKNWQSFLLGMFALFSPITLGYIFYGGVDITFIGFTNVLLSIVFLYLFLNNDDKKFLLLSILFSAFSISIVYFMVLVLLAFLYFIFESFYKGEIKKNLGRCAGFFIGITIINLYWILPFVHSVFDKNIQNVVLSNNAGTAVLNSLKPFSNIIQVLSLHYYDALQNNFHFGVALDFLMVTLFAFIVYLLFVHGQTDFRRSKKYDKVAICLAVFLAISLFLAKGPNEPLGSIFIALFKYVPLFQGFRTYIRFSVVTFFCYIMMAGLIYQKFSNNQRITYGFSALLIIIIIYVAPHFLLLKQNRIQPVALPDPYVNLLQNNSTQDQTTLDVPIYTYNQGYTWGDTSIINQLSSRYFWYGYIGYINENDIRKLLINNFDGTTDDSVKVIENLIAKLNIGQIMYHKDKISDSVFIQNKSQQVLENLAKQGIIIPVSDNTNFTLYQVAPSYFLPHFYIANSLNKINGTIPSMVSSWESSVSGDEIRDADILSDQNTSEFMSKDLNFTFQGDVEIKSTREDTNQYDVNISNVKSAFPLIFSESFNDGWKIEGFDQSSEHFVANGYSNGWIIDPSSFCEKNTCTKNANGSYNFRIKIYYTPQKLFTTGLIISILCLISVTMSLLYVIKKTHLKHA